MPIDFATVYFPDLKTGTTSDLNGNYSIEHLPAAKYWFRSVVWDTGQLVETIDLSETTRMNFIMEYTATEMNEVVVTGLSKAAETEKNTLPRSR